MSSSLICCSLKSLPNNKMLDLSTLNAFADDNSTVVKIAKFVSDRVENIAGKGENAGLPAF